MNLGRKSIAIALLFLGLVLVNYLALSLPVRLDLTAESIYSLSPGTKAILGKIEEPVTLELYASKETGGLPIVYKNYCERVQTMIRQYVRTSRGRLVLNVISPGPDTPEEERATAAGLMPLAVTKGGDQFFFGLVAIQAEQQKAIAALTPQREQFLEYDLSQLIYSVQQTEKRKLGLLTSLPLQGNGVDAQVMAMIGQQPQLSQFVTGEWERSFQLIKVEASATDLPADLDVLAIIHPQNLTAKLQFAIDQFLLSSKPVFLCVDPSSLYFKRQGRMHAMMSGGGPPPGTSSDLPVLLKAYGIAYDSQQIVGDLENAAQFQAPTGVMRNPVWLRLRRESFSAKALPTAQLKSAVFIEAGSLAPQAGSTLTFTPLIQTSDQAGEIAGMPLQLAQPEDIARQITPSGKRTIAALVTGKFKTAFPDGAPKDNLKLGDKASADAPAAEVPAPWLKESANLSTLLIVADTDWLFDDYSVRKQDIFGHTAVEPLNDNIAFAANSVEFLGGSQDLISIRGKGNSLRPFTVVRQMEVEAQKKYQEKLNILDARLQQVQTKLSELRGKKSTGNRLVASPAIVKTIEEFQKQSAVMRAERREIRRSLREDIDRLENRLLVINLLAAPLLLGLFGLWFQHARRK